MNTYLLRLREFITKLVIQGYTKYKTTTTTRISKLFPIISETKSKIGFSKVQNMLVKQYTIEILEQMKKEMEEIFEQKRDLEKKADSHTKNHQQLVQDLIEIEKNLSIIQSELKVINLQKIEIHDQIKKALALFSHTMIK